MTPNYRADIDGLRAVAVLSVLFFHSDISLFKGGFVGVDIFFVISGYLITTIIVREIANNEFSLSKFYERRFRRILPALVVVVVVSMMIGTLLLSPEALVYLGQSVIATAVFSSNILFYFESGYFDGAAEMKPLLHTWSLAVEEQYYIFFPLLLILIAKIGSKHYFRWLAVLGSMSFVVCVVLTSSQSLVAFYWIHTRAWELFIGSILALNVVPTPQKRFLREVYSIIGIIMVAYSIFLYSPKTSFPGIAAVLPTIGAALIIHAGSGGRSLVSMVLSVRPVVYIGLISYSLYLWHWPVVVYTKIIFIKELTGPLKMIMLLLIFSLSIFSWKYVESPFRRKVLFKDSRVLRIASYLVTVVLIVSGLVLKIYPYDIASSFTVKDIENDIKWNYWRLCEGEVSKIKSVQNLCDIGINTKPTSFILWGDSHAMTVASGIDLSAKRIGLNGKIATLSACPPLLAIERPDRMSCNEFNQKVLEFISVTQEIETVILAARWALSTKGTRYKQELGSPVQLVDINSLSSKNLPNVELFELGLRRTIQELHRLGKKVVLVNPIPEVGYDVPSAHLIATKTSRDTNSLIAPTKDEYETRIAEVTSIFREIKNQIPIEIVKPEVYLCDTNYCGVVVEGTPLYRDDDHLSTFGSEYISKAFDSVFKDTAIEIAKRNL